MIIDFSGPAAERLASEAGGQTPRFKLVYDTEGCGCVMNGVPLLQMIAEPEADDRKAGGGPYEVWYEPRHEVFFEDRLKIDWRPGKPDYILQSDNQIYTSHLRLQKQSL